MVRDDEETILTDESGRPIPRPKREDFKSFADYVLASHEFNTKVANVANAAFADQFRRSLKKNKDRTVGGVRRKSERGFSPLAVVVPLGTFTVGLAVGPKLDTLISARPLGDRVTPTVAGVLLTLGGAVVADRVYHRRDVAVPLATLGLGLAGSTLRKKPGT